jgi:circadian clock protein KaiC
MLEVLKSRGSAHLEGRHVTTITPAGMVVHPRREVLARATAAPGVRRKGRLSLGVATLDAMLSGGIVSGSSTAILGAPGAGKTLLGLQFLHAGAEKEEPGLYYGFFETPERLVAKARGVGLPLDAHLRSGAVELLWQPALEQPLDMLAERLFDALERRRVRRLFIDGVDALEVVAAFPGRLPRFLGALTADLRATGVTVLMSEETELFASRLALPVEAISMHFDNIVLLRYVERGARMHRLVSILKVRESDYDSNARELCISPRGLEVAGSPESARAILSGAATEPPTVQPEPSSRPAGREKGGARR